MNAEETDTAGHDPTPGSLSDLVRYFLWLGATGFGGPIALAGHMKRVLVDERGWIRREDYVDGLALAQLAPGPLAAQLAMYLGYVRAGLRGATLVGLAFILPSFVMVWAISVAYVAWGGLTWMQAAFYGVGAAVIAVIARSTVSVARLSLTDAWGWTIAAVLAAVTAWTEQENVWLFLAAGVVMVLRRAPLRASATASSLALLAPSLLQVFAFFASAGAFVFGSGLAIVPFLYGGVVREHAWLTERQFLDAVAVAMLTPGPVVITVAFIGYLVRGTPGLLAATAGVFLPVFLFTVIPAPYFRKHRERPRLKAFVEGVTAAATGAIAGAAFVLARRALVDGWTIGIALAALVAIVRFRVKEPWVIAAAAAVGMLLRGGR